MLSLRRLVGLVLQESGSIGTPGLRPRQQVCPKSQCQWVRVRCVVIVIVDVDHKIFIAVAVVLFDLVAVVHGGRYVANSDIRLRSKNFYLQVLIHM